MKMTPKELYERYQTDRDQLIDDLLEGKIEIDDKYINFTENALIISDEEFELTIKSQ